VLGTEQLEIWRDPEGRHRWVSATDPHQDPGFDEAGAILVRDWSPITRLVSVLQGIIGIAFFLYVVAQITSFFVEGAYEQLWYTNRSRRRAAGLSDHVIVCGAGEHGHYLLGALGEAGIPCVAIEQDGAVVTSTRSRHPDVPVLAGDATEEETLKLAGLERARGLITVLGEDGLNVVAAVTAHQLRPGVRVVSRGFGRVSARRLAAAGCAVVVSGRLAAMRLASALVRPTAVEFLDEVLRPRDADSLRLEDVRVGAPFAGHRLAESDGVGVVPLALRKAGGSNTVYNPDDEERFSEGDLMTVIGTPAQLHELRGMLGSAAAEAVEAPVELEVLDAPNAKDFSAGARAGVLDGHYVVCGAGETGAWIARELYCTERPFVVIDRDPEVLEALRVDMPELVAVEGDAEDPETLTRAGISMARGLAAMLPNDRNNLLCLVTALQANADLRVVSLVHDETAERRIRHSGATVVSKGRIGGGRMAAELLRPQLTNFLDRMLADPRGVRVESALVQEGKPAAGRALRDLDFWAATGVRPVAVVPPGRGLERMIFDPEPHVVLEPGSRLIVIASPAELERVVNLVGSLE
jgi:voltage-gated potassium channel